MNNHISSIRFTIEERILLHLLDYINCQLKIEAPPSITQEGISQTIHIHRKHLPRSLKKLIGKNFIEEKISHITGKKQRMKTYHLTINGKLKAYEIKDFIENINVYMKDKKGCLKEISVKDVKKLSNKFNSYAEILSCITIDGVVDLSKIENKNIEKSQLPDKFRIYKKALEQAWKDGKITVSERDILLNLRKSLNISAKEHVLLEKQVIEKLEKNTSFEALKVYKVALEQALADNKISAVEKAILEKIKKEFNIKET